MKFFFKLLALIVFFVFFGWLYIMYLYLHKENKEALDNINEDFVKKVKVVNKAVVKEKDNIVWAISERQEEMANFVKTMKKEAFEIKDIAERFKDVSERTLRRDMQKLEKTGLIKQVGSTRNSKYRIIS